MITTLYVLLFVLVIISFVIITRTGVINPLLSVSDYTSRTAVFHGKNGEKKGELELKEADTITKSYIGLSKTESLEENSGLLMEYNTTVVSSVGMRNMKYDIDVIYVNSDYEVESIHHLNAPENKFEYYLTYEIATDKGKYVIETNGGWVDKTGIKVGDKVKIN